MKVSDMFTLHQGNGFELINMELDKRSELHFVARTGENNGVVANVKAIERVAPFPAGLLTVALGGSVLSSFVQCKPFYTGFHVMALEPKKNMPLEEKLFYCHGIKMNAYRYQYGRQANKTLKDIPLPDLPDWLSAYRIDYSKINTIIKKIEKKELPLDSSTWRYFNLEDLFSVERGSRLTRAHRIPGKIPFATAGASNEGISDHIANDDMKLYSNVLTIDMFCHCSYRGYAFACDDNILVLFPKFESTACILLFFATVINRDNYRYAYGRQYRQKNCNEHKIKLPVDSSGNPDWNYMETYIKSLPYSDKI